MIFGALLTILGGLGGLFCLAIALGKILKALGSDEENAQTLYRFYGPP